ncbi:MAG: secA translation cis-regulator SecM [Haemophilus pittmaniae]|jgi:uncharacterized protein HI_0908|uniref:secA translation cis-regulator SecM n=1 Tax=Haemophilus pittmaniae TaxID=249188 RepID=UPI0023F42F75|nr:secA translation cis-regulator SecM [Haemophilus pittmaniae]MBS6027279.1 secA translation cis-regulator SecM [Haemophilus pittmaniae]
MQTSKIKPHFWSRLLFSVIAFFALPVAQELDTANTNMVGGNYQTETQSIVSETLATVRELRQGSLQPHTSSHAVDRMLTPRYQSDVFFSFLPQHAPIRAGPLFS